MNFSQEIPEITENKKKEIYSIFNWNAVEDVDFQQHGGESNTPRTHIHSKLWMISVKR